jgi:hypothetical protein
MQLPTAAIRQYARDAGLSDAFLVQHQDLMEAFALRVASGQRKKDQQRVRAWYFDSNPTKCQLFEILEE